MTANETENSRFILHFNEQAPTKNNTELNNGISVIPTLEEVEVIFNFEEGTLVELSVFNVLGQEVSTHQVPEIKSGKATIPMSSNMNGIYFIYLKTNEETITKKFFK